MSGYGPNAPHLLPEELTGALHDHPERTMIMKEWIAIHRKAIAGAAGAGIAAGIAALTAGGNWKTVVIAVVVAALGGGGVVSWSPANKPKAA